MEKNYIILLDNLQKQIATFQYAKDLMIQSNEESVTK